MVTSVCLAGLVMWLALSAPTPCTHGALLVRHYVDVLADTDPVWMCHHGKRVAVEDGRAPLAGAVAVAWTIRAARDTAVPDDAFDACSKRVYDLVTAQMSTDALLGEAARIHAECYPDVSLTLADLKAHHHGLYNEARERVARLAAMRFDAADR